MTKKKIDVGSFPAGLFLSKEKLMISNLKFEHCKIAFELVYPSKEGTLHLGHGDE